MRNRKRVVGKVVVTLILALAGFAAAGVMSGVGLADMGTTMSTGTGTTTVPTTTTNPPPPPPPGRQGLHARVLEADPALRQLDRSIRPGRPARQCLRR